jgi:hypothetical protein
MCISVPDVHTALHVAASHNRSPGWALVLLSTAEYFLAAGGNRGFC